MWIVANQLKGVLKFPGLGIEIPPEGQLDVDSLGREKAESSSQLKIALDNGYLSTIRKTIMLEESEVSRMIEDRIHSIKSNLVKEISDLCRLSPESAGEDR